MTIIYRSVKGSNLTSAEVDGNFSDLDARATANAAAIAAAGGGIESIDVTGNQMTITLKDSSIQGPFELPTVNLIDLFRGAWQPSTPYLENQIVTALGSIYLVLHDHTSESTFDQNAGDTDGDFYELFLKNPAIPVRTVTGDTFTPSVDQANSYFRCTNPSGCAITIPNNDDVAFEIYTELSFRQCAELTTDGTNGIVIAGDSGVTVNGVDGFLSETDTPGAVVMLKKVAANEWDLFGKLAAA